MSDMPEPIAPATPSSSPSKPLFSYHATLGSVYGVWIKNLLLTLITLGIYRAWAKTRMRRFIWSHTEIEGDRLQYLGKGGELFRGFAKIFLLFFLTGIVITVIAMALGIQQEPDIRPRDDLSNEQVAQIMQECGYSNENWGDVTAEVYQNCILEHGGIGAIHVKEDPAMQALNMLPTFLLIYLIYFAQYSALRYRLTRTSWRGIRGRMTGSANRYARLCLGRAVLNVITLGWLIPKSEMIKQSYKMQDLYLGTQRAEFEMNRDGLQKTHIITLLLALPTLWMSRLWYKAALKNKKLANTRFGTLQMAGNYTGGGYLKLYLVNLLILFFTFGLGTPIILQRTVKFHMQHIHVSGELATSGILQAEGDAGNLGEGMEDEMETGLDFDMGII